MNDGDGYVSLSYKRLAAELGNKRLEEAFENKEVLKAKVTQVLDGGVVVTVDEAKVFIPASLISDVYEKDLSKYANQEIEFVITEFNPRKRRIIGDRRQLVAAERAKLKEEALARLEVGQVVEGTVKNVTDFGVSSISAELTDFFMYQRYHGEELRILRRNSKQEIRLKHLLRISRARRLHSVLNLTVRIHGFQLRRSIR